MTDNGIAHVLATHVSQDELAYLRTIREQMGEALQLEQQAAQLEQQALGNRQRAAQLQGAYQSWMGHLCQKYGLDVQTDKIENESGLITRVSRFQPTPIAE